MTARPQGFLTFSPELLVIFPHETSCNGQCFVNDKAATTDHYFGITRIEE